MSGVVHNVITRRQFVFTNVSASQTLDVPLVRAIDVADAKAIDLVVRVHALTVSSTATITVRTRAVSLTSEEPDVDFTNLTELGTATLDTTVTAPALVTATLSGTFGHMIRVFVRGSQPGSAVTLTATLSIDLVVRDN